jgi:hypothetical protein
MSEIQRISTTELSIVSDPRHAWYERMVETLK